MTMSGSSSVPGRLSRADALAELRRIQAGSAVRRTVESLAAPVAILNAQRQVIFSNPAFQRLTGLADAEEVCGRRPGEALGCRHAADGCGDGAACGFCGARAAIVETLQSGSPSTRECHVEAEGAGWDLAVSTTPFVIGGTTFVMVSFRDISDLKRRQSLERIFFHDMLNTASSFRVYLDLLKRRDVDEERRARLIEELSAVCDTLEEEIQGQKMMVSAEQGTLKAQRNLIESLSLLARARRQAQGLAAARDRSVVIAPFSESVTFVSDDALVSRILGNMLKNALEASAPGESVTVGARRQGEGQVAVSVHNDAVMPPEVRGRVFQRYFSTRGEGRGLGTWGMRLLAEEYLGGGIEMSSEPGQGTTFSLILPIASTPS